jgi:hypothetical protein
MGIHAPFHTDLEQDSEELWKANEESRRKTLKWRELGDKSCETCEVWRNKTQNKGCVFKAILERTKLSLKNQTLPRFQESAEHSGKRKWHTPCRLVPHRGTRRKQNRGIRNDENLLDSVRAG